MPSSVPIAHVCPNCGSSACAKVKPTAFLSYNLDRICTACQTRYAPPTPGWASVTFLVVGVALILVGGFWFLRNLGAEHNAGTMFGGGIVVMGVLACRQGIRGFKEKPVA